MARKKPRLAACRASTCSTPNQNDASDDDDDDDAKGEDMSWVEVTRKFKAWSKACVTDSTTRGLPGKLQNVIVDLINDDTRILNVEFSLQQRCVRAPTRMERKGSSAALERGEQEQWKIAKYSHIPK